jgi:hypothetical protein
MVNDIGLGSMLRYKVVLRYCLRLMLKIKVWGQVLK